MSDLRISKTVRERRGTLEKELKISLKNIGCYSLDDKLISTRNCEQMIGVIQLPLGVAGPLKIGHDQYYLPLATTEGALVASVNRGCKAIGLVGGANVFLEKIGTTRGPVFKTDSLASSFKLANWLTENLDKLKTLAQKTSNHLELTKVETQVVGKNVFARFSFDTEEAMGMNMATIATQAFIPLIEAKTQSRCLSLSGNFCVDKKPAWRNFLFGRGRKVWAEVQITEKVLKEVLKTNAQKIFEVWLNKCLIGSALSGSMAFNAHFANIIAAVFAATGQDLAHITEGSLGLTTAEIVDQDLYFSVYLPDLMIGTVGGGTNLATQKEGLGIIFGQEKPKTDILAKVMAGAVLAGELSLLASLAEGSLTGAHLKLARGGHSA